MQVTPFPLTYMAFRLSKGNMIDKEIFQRYLSVTGHCHRFSNLYIIDFCENGIQESKIY